jgi:N-acyl-D-amino-acid deacylase
MPLFLFLFSSLMAADLMAADFDVLLRGARVIDGSGNPWYRADIGVKGGRILAIGRLDGRTADRVIDTAGQVVTPGFIDVHTHIEGGIEKVPRGDNMLMDGVTTVVTGNCGGSAGDLAAWFTKLEELKIGLNVASLIGHNTVRAEVMGTSFKKAGDEDIARMQALVDKGMRDGAVGLSTGLIYIPGTYSDTREVVALAQAAGKFGGVYASHMRDEGEHVLEAIEEAIRAGRAGGLRVQLSHFKIDNRKLWGGSSKSIALVERYRQEGVDVVVDQYPYDRSSTNLGITLPSWALADGAGAVRERLNSADTRGRIQTEMAKMLSDKGQPDYSYAWVARFAPEPSYEGKNISQINRLKGREATVANEIDTILELIAAGGAQMVYQSMGESDVDRIMKYPNTAIASDGGVREFGLGVPHPRSYGTNARVLAEYVRRRGLLTLEDAIRRMTSLPARTFNFRDRGLVREGMAADLLVFDPAVIEDKATYEQPHQFTAGISHVLVNGVLMVDGGKLTENRAGLILRHQPE